MTTESLRSEYLLVRDRAVRLREALMTQVEALIISNRLSLAVPLESRVKTWESIEEKISRKSLTLPSILDLDDLIGLRIILLFKRDISAADKLIRDNLKIIQAEDTSERLAETQFGYQSQHYVITLPQAWLRIPSYSDFAELKVELQLRTAAQHIWAASSHKLQYKNESSVPPSLRRSIHRVSALLETVDLEFDRLLTERQNYVQHELSVKSADEALNVDILASVLTELLPSKNKSLDESYSDLLMDLMHFGVTTEQELRALITERIDEVAQAEAKIASEKKIDHFYKHVGLARHALRLCVGGDKLNAFHELKKQARRESQRKEITNPARILLKPKKRPSAA